MRSRRQKAQVLSRKESDAGKSATTRKAESAGRIVAFCCENSAMKSLEPLSGEPLLRRVEIVKVPCAGRVEIPHVMRRIEAGARSVLVLGCPLDNCKYIHGNSRTAKRVQRARKAVEEAGLDPNRIRMAFLSSVDPHKILNILKEMNTP